MDTAPTTDSTHAFVALLAGALVGGTLTTAAVMIGMLLSLPIGDWNLDLMFLPFIVLICLFATVVWMVGLLLFAAPTWFILHRLRLRGRMTALITGAILGIVSGAVLVWEGEADPSFALLLGTVGPLVALVVRRVAYGLDRSTDRVVTSR